MPHDRPRRDPPLQQRATTRRVAIPVWDPFVRIFHWSLVVSFATAWFSTEGPRWLHIASGTVALELVAARVIWGFVGRRHARFDRFVPAPRQLLRYVGALLRGREPRSLGHNPAAAVMILFLLAMVAAIGVSGWMMTTRAFWGNEWVEETHVLLVDLTLAALVLHVSAAVYESLRQRDNLVAAMFTGVKHLDLPAKDERRSS